MVHIRRGGRLCLPVILVSVWAIAGCQKAEPPDLSGIENPPTGSIEAGSAFAGDEAGSTSVSDLPEPPDTATGQLQTPFTAVDPSKTPDPAAKTEVGKLVPIEIELPAPAFRGTPVPRNEPNVEEPLGRPRGPFFAPEGTVNLASGRPVTSSDPAPASGELDFVTDGAKDASDFGHVELRPGSEWVQIDLGQQSTIYAVLVWHNHAEGRVYRDVIVQVSDDPDFLDAHTVFNNDYDNSSGLGIGGNMGYVETSEGKLTDSKGVEGRYVRLYSKGNHVDGKNHYTEVEVFGKPAA